VLLNGGCEAADAPAADEGSRGTILLTQAQFTEKTDKAGKIRSIPGAARLVILRKTGDKWEREVVEDPESNVFHKAAFFADPTAAVKEPGILTIGANAAAIKVWHHRNGGWIERTLWQTEFGGKHDRLRDFEIGDVTGDGKPDIALATHDQGVVAVLQQTADGWQPVELDRKKKTFVHEIELGDLDGDGLAEIYATPSQPNRFDGTPQPGEIVTYRRKGEAFERRVVEQFPSRHVKEILVASTGGAGRPVLWAAVEAELGSNGPPTPDSDRVLLKRYEIKEGRYAGEVVCTLPDALCRFLNAGDVDGDGKVELIASTHRSGIWLVRPTADRPQPELIDKDSGGFEHATALGDLDGDGVQEIYVAADKQREVRRYRWAAGKWQREVISPIEERKITFGICVGRR
jgi:hypothetical protein